jgi:stalled ribosome rescue protein Dom34
METKKRMGVWMDHSVAHLMELKNDLIVITTVDSEFTHEEKAEALSKSENIMHNKEQHQQLSFYKKIQQVIKSYNEILLFGPTTAKNELLTLLKADHHFDAIKIDVKSADKMTEKQQHAFVKEHFKS